MQTNKLFFLTLLLCSTTQAALNDTGVTTCSNATQNGLPCPVAGFPGQDAEYGTNSFDFTKLDANGNEMSVAATNHSCVQDNVTGLMWEVKTDDGGLRDKDNTYTFYQAATFAANVNATNLCGHNDWRVPQLKELVSIVDYSAYNPAIDTDYFPNTPVEWFWSASPDVYGADYAWIVVFRSGSEYGSHRTGTNRARLVCAGQSLSFVFTDNANGTITDSTTGLIWAKCPVGQSGTNCEIGSASRLTWAQALNAAKDSTLAGRNDWRVPNIQELRSIVDYTKYNPSINSIYFPNTPADAFWSASPYANYTDLAWIVDFYYGDVSYYYRTVTSRARLVCAGQSLSFALNVAKAGNGAGSVLSTPAGINCSAVCTANFAQNTSVTLTATPTAGSVFAGWSGDADCSDGTVTMDAAKNCTATFNLSITAPTVTTGTASNITQTSATLNGTVLSSGATSTVSFEFGKETSPPGTLTSPPNPLPLTGEGGKEFYYSPLLLRRGAGGEVKSFTYTETISAIPSSVYSSTAVAVSANKTGLTCGTTYYFRTQAVNSAGTGFGTDQIFTTNACSYTATATAGTGGTVTPGNVTVNYNARASFTVTANNGYSINSAVTGTCPPGSWNGNVWTTGAIVTNCTVNFSFVLTPVNSWLYPITLNLPRDKQFTLNVTAKSDGMHVANYEYVITFDPTKLSLVYNQCDNGVCPGVNALNTNSVFLSGNNSIRVIGLGGQTAAGNDLQLLIIHFKSKTVLGSTNVGLTTIKLVNTSGEDIGSTVRGAIVNVSPGICGDANGDTVVNIIDALAIARKLVTLPPPPTIEPLWADVNKDNNATIIDALHIARYSIGLVLPPEVCNIGQPL